MDYDIIVIGSGPGGYVAAIRASQLGFKTAIIEKAEPGGICLNWGCIPTKALLKSVRVLEYLKSASSYGVNINGEVNADFHAIIKRSRDVAANMSKGVQFLLKKNKIELINGIAYCKSGNIVEVTNTEGEVKEYSAKNIIIATGARSRELTEIKQDGTTIIGYKEALALPSLPESMVIVGSGAIGSEFAYLYNGLGVKVTLVEMMQQIVPFEDEDVSKQLERNFKRSGIKVLTATTVVSSEIRNGKCEVKVQSVKGEETLSCDILLSAAGVVPNIEGIGLEEIGIITEKGKIVVDEFYRTKIKGYYAIGDIVKGPALAHVASAEAICCIEKIAGINVEPLDYKNIPACTYTFPELASVGMTEKAAVEGGFNIRTGKFPFMASGKATASGHRDGFVKIIIDKDNDKILGAHLIGDNVTEMISGIIVARKASVTAHQILKSVHPHPTMSEAINEAIAAAYGEVIHL